MSTTKPKNLVTGSLWKKILLFALPLAATSMLQQLFNAADLAVIGRFTGDMGEKCIAAIGSTSQIIALIINAFIGLSIGTNVTMASAVGRGDKETVQKIVHTSVLFSVIVGFVLLLVGQFFSRSILAMTNVPNDILPLATTYLKIYFMGAPMILLYNFEAAIFMAKGDTKTPLIILAISGAINVVLNIIFVVVFNMTIEGVAIATIVSNLIGAVVLFVFLMKSRDDTKLSLKKISIAKKELSEILKIGIPTSLEASVFCIANIVVQAAINSLDTIYMAGSSVASNVETFAYLLFTGFSKACVTFVGQNRGAQKFDRCKKTLRVSMIESWIALGIGIMIILGVGKSILSLFNTNPEVIEVGYTRLIYMVAYAYFFTSVYEVLGSYLRGYGISMLPAVITMIGVCGTRIIWIFTAFKFNPTFETILMAFPLSMIITALLMTGALIYLKPDKKIIKQTLISEFDGEKLSNANIITIGREFGSGGREIAKRLAEELGYKYYDKELVDEIAEKMQVSETYVENNLAHLYKNYHYVIRHSFSSRTTPIKEKHIELITEQRNVLQKIAEMGENCVIVGRAADITLSAYSPLKIFIYADMDAKVLRCKHRAADGENLTDKEIVQKIKKIDRARASYYDMVSTVDWGDTSGYHLCVNTTDVDIKAIVPMIADYAREWFKHVN